MRFVYNFPVENVIEIKDLHKSYGSTKAVNGVSFKVKKGELFAFLGVNGAGKSTTINILVGVLSKDSGEVMVLGHPAEHISSILPEVGIVFQNSVLDRKLSAYDNIFYKAALYGISKAEFKRRLAYFDARFGLQEFIRRPIGKLSGGQRRKIDIVRALIHHPKILILDEPTTGLDPQSRKQVFDLVNDLRRSEGLTVILTTHYMEEAANSDYVVIMDKGRVVADGTPIDLKNQYACDFLRIYRPSLEVLKALREGHIPYTQGRDMVEARFKTTSDAKGFILAHPDEIDEFEVLKGTMDDVFLSVTGKELEIR